MFQQCPLMNTTRRRPPRLTGAHLAVLHGSWYHKNRRPWKLSKPFVYLRQHVHRRSPSAGRPSHHPLACPHVKPYLDFDTPMGSLSDGPVTATLPQSYLEIGLEREPVDCDRPVLHQRHLPTVSHPLRKSIHRPGMRMLLTSYCVKRVGMSLYVSRYEMFLPRQVR
jgi:hypothetical protein